MIGDKAIDHVVYLKAEFLSHTLISNKKHELYTIVVDPSLNRSACHSIGVVYYTTVYPLYYSEFPRVLEKWRTARVRISNASWLCKQWDSF